MSTWVAEHVEGGGQAGRTGWPKTSDRVAEQVEAEAEHVRTLAVDVAMKAAHVESGG